MAGEAPLCTGLVSYTLLWWETAEASFSPSWSRASEAPVLLLGQYLCWVFVSPVLSFPSCWLASEDQRKQLLPGAASHRHTSSPKWVDSMHPLGSEPVISVWLSATGPVAWPIRCSKPHLHSSSPTVVATHLTTFFERCLFWSNCPVVALLLMTCPWLWEPPLWPLWLLSLGSSTHSLSGLCWSYLQLKEGTRHPAPAVSTWWWSSYTLDPTTCTSSALPMALKPSSCLFSTASPPLLNPLICTLRNRI